MKEMPRFDYFALHYLKLWEGGDQALHTDLSSDNPTLEALTKAMHAFRISRSFRGIAEAGNRKYVLESLLGVGKDGAKAVNKLASKFEDRFSKENLSAASKLLWFRHRSPFLVYDRNAVTALSALASRRIPRSYDEFEKVWRSEFKKVEAQVAAACGRLTSLHRYFHHAYGEDELEHLVSSLWFHERVFDVYLWAIGGRFLVDKGARGIGSPGQNDMHVADRNPVS
ncbi:hypothetical protein [Luteimonas granuli]|uniref:Uncharacterized protein n=1 Tax=Luteimonas granuli TaxID=1176533 RepID=A0A518N446_9GAMM|nr:hypothetical protein [Luteimonas granuli]QDW66700.1 hypothetical protein FPZ22_07175 [Luteimonas granuli]